MTFTPVLVIRIIGVCLAAFLCIHFMGIPFGILAAVTVALLYLPA